MSMKKRGRKKGYRHTAQSRAAISAGMRRNREELERKAAAYDALMGALIDTRS